MIKRSRLFFFSLLAVCCLILSGCAMNSQPQSVLYDLGPPSSMPEGPALPAGMPPLIVFQVNSPDWLDSTKMYYRLEHVNAQQARFYTLSRWNMAPSKLFRDRLKSRIVSAGGEIGGGRVPKEGQLRLIVHVEDFSQYFKDDANSEARIALRVSVLDKDGSMIAQKGFLHTVAAKSPDAPGGAQALSAATDDVISEILAWVVENSRKGESRS